MMSGSMREFAGRFKPFFLYAAVFSLIINFLMLIPSLFMIQVFDRVLSSRSLETLVMLVIVTVLALSFMAVLDVIRSRLLARAGVTLEKMLGPRVLGDIVKRSAVPGGADAIHGLRDVTTLRTFLTGPGIIALFDSPWVPIYVVIIGLFHPVMGAVALTGAVIMLVLAYLNERLSRDALGQMQTVSRIAGRFADQTIKNAETAGALGMVENLVSAWQTFSRGTLALQLQANGASSVMSSASRFMRQFLQVAMLTTGAWLVITHATTTGVMIAGTILLARALAPVETAIAGWKTLVDARNAFARLNDVLESESPQYARTQLPAPVGKLAVERVIFGFRGRDLPTIRGVSFQVDPGEVLAVVGPSAAGKSTLARLIVGSWRPQSGTVRIDGADIGSWDRERLSPYVGYLPQNVELFAGTVSENIARLGERDSEAIVRAAMRANAHEMILRLPQGYETPIGDGGAFLSAGQGQRVALARALYRDPRLVLLDEPNSNLDAEGEVALTAALRGLKEDNVTTIVITHRPSLLAAVDRVLLLRNGTIEKIGKLHEVLPPALVRGISADAPAHSELGAVGR